MVVVIHFLKKISLINILSSFLISILHTYDCNGDCEIHCNKKPLLHCEPNRLIDFLTCKAFLTMLDMEMKEILLIQTLMDIIKSPCSLDNS